jgi:predicted GIY-YIG superfamily endonuclease/RNase H-fold protein (predicted Holliday junction resolvase)
VGVFNYKDIYCEMKQLIRHILKEQVIEILELKKLSNDEFISKVKKVHGDYYDYSETDYKTMRDKIDIICPEHGVFSQTAGYHANGSGCPKCGTKKEITKWTDDELRKEALKYQVYSDFINLSPSAYQTAKKKRSTEFLEDITKHMIKTTRWTDESLKGEAAKYKTKGEFQKNNPVAYTTALRRGILDDICSHMERAGNKYLRYIYVYEFPDKSVYVGLTYNLKERNQSHTTQPTSSVYQHAKLIGFNPKMKSISELLNKDEAAKVENEMIEKYKSEGWTILNKAKAGALGGSTLKWTVDAIKNEISKHETLNDFIVKSPSAFNAAKKIGKDFLTDVTKNLIKVQIKLTDEELQDIALKYTKKMDFINNEPRAYSQAIRKGDLFFNKITSHMLPQKIKWTDDMLEKESKKYKKRTDFYKGSPSAYTTAKNRKLLDKFFPKN